MSNPTELPDLDRIEALRTALENVRDTSFGYDGDSGVKSIADGALSADDEAARGAQPEGEAPQAEKWRHAANEWADTAYNGLQHLRNIEDGIAEAKYARENMEKCCQHASAVAEAAATLSPLCGAQHADSGKEADVLPEGWSASHPPASDFLTDEANSKYRVWVSRLSPPFCNEAGERGWAGPTLTEALATAHAALGLPLAAQQAAAPGSLAQHCPFCGSIDEVYHGKVTYCDNCGADGPSNERDGQPVAKWSDRVATSAPGTPEAPSELMQALTTGIPLQEPVYIAKALRAQRKARVSLAAGTGPSAAVFLVNIQMTPWTYTKETAEAYAEGYNRALGDYRAALVDVAAQLDGGQEAALTRCAAGRDGECGHKACPQLRDKEPAKSGRHCPLDQVGSESNG